MGPQEVLSVLGVSGLPSTKWEHRLSLLWGEDVLEEEGSTLSPQYGDKAVGTTAHFALSLRYHHLFGFKGEAVASKQAMERLRELDLSPGLRGPQGNPLFFPSPPPIASYSLPRLG